MESQKVKENILRTLLYYDIFDHPLKRDEVFTFLPENTVPRSEIFEYIDKFSADDLNTFAQKDGYVYIKPNGRSIDRRLEKERYSRRMWKAARFITHIIKRFPFVRAVLVTGTLSKNSSAKESDLDFMVITKKDRLWISRTLLMLFKKMFLFNSYKYFCINYFITEDNLEIKEKNIFTATEIAHIKATYKTELMERFIHSNEWVKNFFPNYNLCDPYFNSPGFKVNNRKSFVQKLFELFFTGKFGDRLNERFMNITSKHWLYKYHDMNETDRERMFTSRTNVSKNHPVDMQRKILFWYNEKLKQYNLDS